MIPISVCIITKNQAAHLQKCLKALKPYPFEIVVTDTGSTDHSLEIARQYADRVCEFAWIHDFSAAKNFCVSHASHNTILSLDTDEFIRPFDWEALQSAVEKNPKALGTVEFYNYFDVNGKTEHQLIRLERLFNRRYYRFVNPIHEVLEPIGSLEPSVYDTPVSVNHVGYQGTEEELKAKSRRNIALIRSEIEGNPEDPYLYFQLAQAYMLARDHAGALPWFRKAFELNPVPGADYTLVLLCNYADILLDENRTDEATAVLSYHDSFSDHRDFLCLAGRIYLCMGQPLKALPEFIQALSAPRYSSVDPRTPSYYIGVIYEMFGKRDIARTHYENCGEYPPAAEALKRLSTL